MLKFQSKAFKKHNRNDRSNDFMSSFIWKKCQRFLALQGPLWTWNCLPKALLILLTHFCLIVKKRPPGCLHLWLSYFIPQCVWPLDLSRAQDPVFGLKSPKYLRVQDSWVISHSYYRVKRRIFVAHLQIPYHCSRRKCTLLRKINLKLQIFEIWPTHLEYYMKFYIFSNMVTAFLLFLPIYLICSSHTW